MEQVSTRKLLQDLAATPIGSPNLQKEADLVAKSQHLGTPLKPSAELLETKKRATKLWLPQGRKPPRPRQTCNEPTAEQADIEDAVEAAGGERGNRAA